MVASLQTPWGRRNEKNHSRRYRAAARPPRVDRPAAGRCLLWLSAVLLAACSSAHVRERYYIPGTRDGAVQNFYRVDIEGEVVGTELRYLSGFFDEDALDRYFNTFTQPEGGALFTVDTVNNEELEKRAPATETRDADPRGLGRKLVLIMSQNSEAIADQIGAISQSEGFATVVGRLVFKEQLAEIEAARVDSTRLVQMAEGSKVLASDLATRLTTSSPPDSQSTKQQLLIFVNQVAGNLGAPRFLTWAKAQQWLQENQSRLTGGAQ